MQSANIITRPRHSNHPDALHSNALFCRLSRCHRDLAAAQLPLSMPDLPAHLQSASQGKSPFFKLARELRDEIYILVLTSPNSSINFWKSTECECIMCQNRRLSPDLITDSAVTNQSFDEAAHNAKYWPLFASCRQIHDEARPILQQVNALWIDAKAYPLHILKRIAVAQSLHRGIRLPLGSSPVLVACAFNFGFNHNASISPMETFKRFNEAIRGVPNLIIRRIKVQIKLWRHLLIVDYVPLLRALESIKGVETCDIWIKTKMMTTEAEVNILQTIGNELQEGGLRELKLENGKPKVTYACRAFPRSKAAAIAAVAAEKEGGDPCFYHIDGGAEKVRCHLMDEELDRLNYGEEKRKAWEKLTGVDTFTDNTTNDFPNSPDRILRPYQPRHLHRNYTYEPDAKQACGKQLNPEAKEFVPCLPRF